MNSDKHLDIPTILTALIIGVVLIAIAINSPGHWVAALVGTVVIGAALLFARRTDRTRHIRAESDLETTTTRPSLYNCL